MIEAISELWVVGWRTDKNGRLERIDPAWREVTGQSLDAALGLGWLDAFHPDDQAAFIASLRDATISRAFFRSACRLKLGNASYNRVLAVAAPQIDADGAFLGHVGTLAPVISGETADWTDHSPESRATLEAALASLSEAVFIADAEGRVVDFNDNFVRYHRFSDRDECSRGITDFPKYLEMWFPDGATAPIEQWAMPRALRGETGSGVEYRLRRKDTGETWWGVYDFSSIRDQTGKITGAVVASRDITSRKQAEAALRESEERYRSLVEQAVDGIFLADSSGRYLDANAAGVKMLGYTIDEIRQSTIADLIAPEELARMPAHLATLDTGAVERSEWRFQCKDGSIFVGEVVGRRLPDGRLLGILRDITERRKIEEALRQSEDTYRALFEGSRDGVVITDMDGRIEHANAAYQEMLGYSLSELRLTTYPQLTPERWHESEAAIVRDQVLAQGDSREYDKEYIRKDGSVFPVSVRVWLARDAVGRPQRMCSIVRDITERKRAEAAQIASEQRWRLALDISQMGAWELNLENNTAWRSLRHDQIFGYGELLPEWTYDIFLQHVLEEDRDNVDWCFQQAKAKQQDWSFECRIHRADGAVRWIFAHGKYICDGDLQPVRIFGLVVDITERKQAEAALRASEELNRRTLQALPAEIAVLDQEGRIIATNDSWDHFANDNGASLPSVTVGASYLDVCRAAAADDDAANRALAGVEAVLAGRQSQFTMEYPCHGPGAKRWFYMTVVPLGAPRDGGAAITHLDITERKQAEEKLRESEERFRVSFANASIGFAMTAPDGRFFDANPAYCAISGYTLDELRKYELWQLIHPDDRAATLALVDNMLAGEIPDFVIEHRHIRQDGETIWIRKSAALIRGADGAPRWIIALVEDITARVRAEEFLREADRQKDAFIATLAHELRNPLTPIHNAAHILKKKHDVGPRDAALYDMIERQTAHLVRLVDELLEISRISLGKIELRRESVDMATVLRDALEMCQASINSKGHHLTVHAPNAPLMVLGDPVRLVQIAVNLINNAAKYTLPGGRIEIGVSRVGGEAELRVRDDGLGIDPAIISRIFEPFAQTGEHARLSEGGLGIGLAVVRKLVDLHGGSVEGHSDGPGKGSEFVVRLPLEDILSATSREPEAVDIQSERADHH